MFWKILIVLVISMIPLVELRGAIPVAIGMDLGLPEWLVLIVAIIGNMIPIPFIYFFARKFLEWGSKKKWKPLKQFCNFCLKKGEKGGEKLLKKTGNYGAYFALFLGGEGSARCGGVFVLVSHAVRRDFGGDFQCG